MIKGPVQLAVILDAGKPVASCGRVASSSFLGRIWGGKCARRTAQNARSAS